MTITMKSELDLVREFTELAEVKVDSWGTLPLGSEKRFQELRAFFDDLMERRARDRPSSDDRYETFEIKSAIPRRSRLRVPAEMSLFFCHDDGYAPGKVLNVSRGGLFLRSDMTVDPGKRLTIYMPNLGRGYETLFETAADVIWAARDRIATTRGMGVRFRELHLDAESQLDDFIVAFLRERLSKSASLALRPGSTPERRIIV
jgi:PilZ domain